MPLSLLQNSFFQSHSRILFVWNNSAVVLDWWLRFTFFWWLFYYYVVYRGWPALLNNPADISWIQDSKGITREHQSPVVSSFSKEHTGTFLPSRKYFVYVCCFIGQDSFLFNMWSRLVLPISSRFILVGRMTFKCPSNSILPSKFYQINPFLPLFVKVAILSF